MRLVFRLGLLCGAVALVLGLASSAGARPPALAKQVGGSHILVHYDPAAINDAGAKAVLDAAETAYSVEVGQWGFQAPPTDGNFGGDSRVDIYIMRPEQGSGEGGFTTTDDELDNGAGFIELDPKFARPAYVAHELFHLVQYGYVIGELPFLYEATAEWAASQIFPTKDLTAPTFLTVPQGPLDCPGSSCSGDAGYGQWPFFAYASERFGPGVVRAIWEQLAGLSDQDGTHEVEAIARGISAGGGSLADVWNGYVRANLAPAGYKNSFLHALSAKQPASQPLTLSSRRLAASVSTSVDHLAARYVLVRSSVCTKKKSSGGHVSVTVNLPAGISAVPSARVNVKGQPATVVSLAVSGRTATASLPFASCGSVLLALPNPSLDQDGASFDVSLVATP